MEYKVRFLPVGERNLQPPEGSGRIFEAENKDRYETRMNILWGQLSNSVCPKELLEKAALLLVKGGGK